MSEVWRQQIEPAPIKIDFVGWLRVAKRGLPLGLLVFGCLMLLLLVRLVERPLFGAGRPWTPYITQFVCRSAFFIIGMEFEKQGDPMRGAGAVVANHSSWLDIFALNASKRIYFVSKAEVAKWPGIGWLARATGTVFIKRDRREAASQIAVFKERLSAGHKLLFFPEGTSTDGQQVLPFKTTLFASFMASELRDFLQVQPVSVVYHPPQGQPKSFYGWWGEMVFATHLLRTLAARSQGSIDVIYHPALKVAEFTDRKALAKAAELAVRSGHESLLTR